MKNILVVLGTRPEAIKLAPVILELQKNKNYNVLVCNTEQQKELFPEEAIRQMTSRITARHFAPTNMAYNSLLKENIDKSKIYLTGNTVIDALSCLSENIIKQAAKNLETKGIVFNDKLVLITAHRRENHGERLDNILEAIKVLAAKFIDHQFIFPVHPNPNVHKKVHEQLEKLKNVVLTTPLDYPDLVCLMKNTKLVMTDSGGIQEEAPTFGNPILVMRYETERTEGIEAGFAKLVGADKEKIINEASVLLSKSKEEIRLDGKRNPYGDGKASERICAAIADFFEGREGR